MKIKSLFKKSSGFTLIELLVVISIIGMLSSIVLVSVNGMRIKARDARRISDLTQIRNALELYRSNNGYYPQSSCGWDCNQYRISNQGSWASLATDLAPYIAQLPVDPINTGNAPWFDGSYVYAYGNVGRSTYPHQYDLTAQLEDTGSPLRCAIKHYTFFFNNSPWCPTYSNQIYEVSF